MDTLPNFLSESERDLQKYGKLVVALRHATDEIRSLTHGESNDIEDIFKRLLPHYVKALEAQGGFILRRFSQNHENPCIFNVVFTQGAGWPDRLQSNFLGSLIERNYAQVIPSVSNQNIPELLSLDIQNAIVVSMNVFERAYVIGIYNKQGANQYPFLAADRTVLESLIVYIAASLHTAERLYQEHAAIQRISQAVVDGDKQELLKLVTQFATKLSDTKYASIFELDTTGKQLCSDYVWDAVDETKVERGFSLPMQGPSLNAMVARKKDSQYVSDITTSNIPFVGNKFELDVLSAYCVPLVSRSDLIGTLYIASTSANGISTKARKIIDRLAQHIAIALSNAQLFNQHIWALKLDADVIKLQETIANVLRERSQAEQIHTVLQEHFSADANFFIATYDENDELIRLYIVCENGKQVRNLDEHHHYGPRKRGEKRGLIDYMLDRNLLILDVPDSSIWEDRGQIEPEFRSGIQCCIVVALQLPHENRIMGWIGFRGTQKAEMFDEYHKELLKRSAPYIAVVLHNSREYDQKIVEQEAVSQFQTTISGLSETEAGEIKEISTEVRNSLEKIGLRSADMYIALYLTDDQIIRIPVMYIDGQLVPHDKRSADPRLQNRKIDARNGFTEWILRTGDQIVTNSREEIQAWQRHGVTDLPTEFQCWLGVPMRVAGGIIGVLALRSSSQANLFSSSHVELLQTIANQAAITIENARKYQQVNELYEQRTALYQAGKAISEAGVERDEVLKTIIEQAIEKTGSHLGMLYQKDQDTLKLVVAQPQDIYEKQVQKYQRISIEESYLITRAVSSNQAELLRNVYDDPHYIDISDGRTNSALAVVLRDGSRRDGEIRGAIYVEHEDIDSLDENDRQLLILLSNLAVAAIQNAEQAKELDRSRVIAIMSTLGAEVIHDINRKIGHIRWQLHQLSERNDLLPAVKSKLHEIDEITDTIRLQDLPSESFLYAADDDQNSAPYLDQVLAAEVDEFKLTWKQRIAEIDITFESGCGTSRIQIQEFWLRRILRHYLNNAESHSPESGTLQIEIRSLIKDNEAYVFVQDNGSGVRDEIRDQLFSSPTKHEELGLGRGLLLVGLICEASKGHAWLDWSKKDVGSRFAFSVPIWVE